MANFPNSVTSFAARSNGAVIDASHINALQDETNAIEDGYLNGSARLNSSNSTVANLSVTGGSTFASTIAISTQTYIFPSSRASLGDVLAVASTSGSTATLQWQPLSIASGATVSTGVIRQDSLPSWDIFNDASTAIASGSSNAFSFNAENFLRGNVTHSTGVGSSQLTIVSTGLYFVTARGIVNAASANAGPQMNIRFNDASTNVLSHKVTASAGASLPPITYGISGIVHVSSGGTFSLTQFAGDNSTWGSTDQSLAVRFSGHFLG